MKKKTIHQPTDRSNVLLCTSHVKVDHFLDVETLSVSLYLYAVMTRNTPPGLKLPIFIILTGHWNSSKDTCVFSSSLHIYATLIKLVI